MRYILLALKGLAQVHLEVQERSDRPKALVIVVRAREIVPFDEIIDG